MNFDPTNAPPGYRAAPNPGGLGCRLPDGTECALRRHCRPCLMNACGFPEFDWSEAKLENSCVGLLRPDGTEAIFVKAAYYGNEEDE